MNNNIPYPLFNNPLSNNKNSFFSFIYDLLPFHNKKYTNEQIGFMPCSNNNITQISTLDIIILPNTTDEDNDSSSLSTSSSASSSDDSLLEIDNDTPTNTTVLSNILSDILCDYDIQTKNINESMNMSLESFDTVEAEDSLPMIPIESDTLKTEEIIVKHTREIRSNSSYFRIIVAEVNMMRSQKIVCPLKQRRFLPKRLDQFEHKSSPLKHTV